MMARCCPPDSSSAAATECGRPTQFVSSIAISLMVAISIAVSAKSACWPTRPQKAPSFLKGRIRGRILADMTEQIVITPVILQGRHMRLEPLTLEHVAELAEVGLDDDLWKWIPTPVRTPEEMNAYVQTALQEQATGSALPFALIEKSSGRAIGSTRYANIERVHHRLEIGWTWVAREWQRTTINTEAKYLLLRHAFETLKCMRVELKTDSLKRDVPAPQFCVSMRPRRRHFSAIT